MPPSFDDNFDERIEQQAGEIKREYKPSVVVCSDCGMALSRSSFPGMTETYYDLDPRGPWAKFGRPGEEILCNGCMHRRESYRAVYGVRL